MLLLFDGHVAVFHSFSITKLSCVFNFTEPLLICFQILVLVQCIHGVHRGAGLSLTRGIGW